MPFNGLPYLLAGQFKPVFDDRTLGDSMTQAVQRQTAAQQARDVSANAEKNQAIAQAAEDRAAAKFKAEQEAAKLGIPAKELEAKRARLKLGLLGQMYPGIENGNPPDQSLPPYMPPPQPGLPMSRETDVTPLPPPQVVPQALPQIQNQFGGKTLAELRQLKVDNSALGDDFLAEYIDPIIAKKSETEELIPALQEISKVSDLPGATRDDARIKAAELSRIISKYPLISNDPRFKEALTFAIPKNTDAVLNPYQEQSGKRQTTQQVIGLENQLRDEYEKGSGESRTISRAGQDIAAALETNNPLSVRMAVTKYSKIADPTTGVLGNEANATEKAAMGDLINSIDGMAEKMLLGKMTPETIRNFKTATRDLMRVQKNVFKRLQERTKSRFQTYRDRFPDLNLSLDAVMGKETDREAENAAFDAFEDAPAQTGVKPDKRAMNQAEYDALPHKVWYRGPSGKRAFKP